MKPALKNLVAIYLGAVIAGIAVTVFAADAPPPVEVKVTRPARGEIFRFVALPGSLKANQSATLYAKVSGYLKTLTVDKGDAVTAGQSLGEIEVPELLADRTKFQAEVKVAEVDFKRVSAAQAKAPDLVTPQSVEEAGGRLDIARANLERTETLLAYARLVAPFNGIVTARFVDPGAFIPSAAAGGAAGNAAVLTIMDFSTVRAQVAVPELEAARVQAGQPVKVSVESAAGKIYEARVSRFAYALDDATKTMLVEADLPNAQNELRPGMYVSVKIGVEKHSDALLLPVAALVMEKANAFVFLADGGKAKKTPVKIGFNDGANVEIVGGLKGGESIVLAGKLTLADGQAIHVTEAE